VTDSPVSGSAFWSVALRLEYALLRVLDPVVRMWWRGYGLGNVCELVVPGRLTGLKRSVLVGLLVADGSWYLGHPNGETGWTRNLEAAGGRAELIPSWPRVIPVVATRLPRGEERVRAILATGQHPFPGNLVYRLARRHVLAVGVYFRVEPVTSTHPGQTATCAAAPPPSA
jgi:hypothetical protein